MPIPIVIHTKITPPRSSLRTLERPRVVEALLEALNFRLTVLQAGAGYGKSTALAGLIGHHQPLIWYQLTEEDADPLVFLLHLCHATRLALPHLEDLPLPLLEAWEGSRGPLPAAQVVDQYINSTSRGLRDPVLLVIDDFHLVEASSDTRASPGEIGLIIDRLVGLAPPNLHLLLASRMPLHLPNQARWRSQGEMHLVDQSVLAFTPPEITALYASRYHYELTSEEAELLSSATEGWAIALHLIWQSLRSRASASVEDALAHQAASLDSLFVVLAHEVFGNQPEDVQDFMRVVATLREMTPEACEALRQKAAATGDGSPNLQESIGMLAYLRRQDLFVVDAGDGALRFHHIFHSFLRQQSSEEQRRTWHTAAADFYRQRGSLDSAFYHLIRAGLLDDAAAVLVLMGRELLTVGRLDTLAGHLDTLPPSVLGQHPDLLSYMGDLARLHSRFQEALGWYEQAASLFRDRGQTEGIGRALRGQARVYLDTVNPSKAEELLEQALRLSEGIDDRQSQARLYELLAENKLNAGRPQEAERLSQKAEELRTEGPSDSQLILRVLLRTGRLQEARQKLEERAAAERHAPVATPRAHRETLLMLSLIYSFQGQGELAYQTAQEGTRRGIELESPFITAVGHMRQGHALMLLDDPGRYSQARAQFEMTTQLSRTLMVTRLRVEAHWGLCRAYGYQGDLTQAQLMAQEAIEIATQAGDEWIASLVRLSYGASLILAARYEAAQAWLSRAIQGFQECSDPFGQSAAQIWQCVGWFRQKDSQRLRQVLPQVLSECHAHGYNYLLTRTTLLGPPDPRILVPLLIWARDSGIEPVYVSRLLAEAGLPEVALHPGYQLRVSALGGFQVWRGDQPVQAKSWRREKSRQLFQLLITHRSSVLDRDQVVEYLWPELDPATAQRNFKVTLNTLYTVLEPEREPGSESAFIFREGTSYGIRPGTDLWVDVDDFVAAVRHAEAALYESPEQALQHYAHAMSLYTGEYLPEARYETWAAAERERLAVLFLRSADRYSELLLQHKQPAEAIEVCGRILASDNCWERAYRHLMLAFHELGDRGQVARTYQRCLQTLHAELEVAPATETEELYHRLTQGE